MDKPDDYMADMRDERRAKERERGCWFPLSVIALVIIGGVLLISFYSQNIYAQTSPIPPKASQPVATASPTPSIPVQSVICTITGSQIVCSSPILPFYYEYK